MDEYSRDKAYKKREKNAEYQKNYRERKKLEKEAQKEAEKLQKEADKLLRDKLTTINNPMTGTVTTTQNEIISHNPNSMEQDIIEIQNPNQLEIDQELERELILKKLKEEKEIVNRRLKEEKERNELFDDIIKYPRKYSKPYIKAVEFRYGITLDDYKKIKYQNIIKDNKKINKYELSILKNEYNKIVKKENKIINKNGIRDENTINNPFTGTIISSQEKPKKNFLKKK